jgi:hypothetical protein
MTAHRPMLPRPPFCHAATERPIPRPTDPTEQTLHSSGKAKDHTLKNTLVIDAALQLVFLRATERRAGA